MTYQTRYPKLFRAVKWVAILSDGEAESCLRDYKSGHEYSSEAVAHFGGTTRVIQRAVSFRHMVSRIA